MGSQDVLGKAGPVEGFMFSVEKMFHACATGSNTKIYNERKVQLIIVVVAIHFFINMISCVLNFLVRMICNVTSAALLTLAFHFLTFAIIFFRGRFFLYIAQLTFNNRKHFCAVCFIVILVASSETFNV